MEIEYSNEVRGEVFAYRFEKWEKRIIADALIPKVVKLRKRIEILRDHPKNEGQATYRVQMDEIEHEINLLNYIINTFNKD